MENERFYCEVAQLSERYKEKILSRVVEKDKSAPFFIYILTFSESHFANSVNSRKQAIEIYL